MARKSYIRSLKKPDDFVAAGREIGKYLQKNTKALMAFVVVLLVVLVAIGVTLKLKEDSSAEGRSALYHAQEKIREDLKNYESSLKPKTEKAEAKKADPKAPPAPPVDEPSSRFAKADPAKIYSSGLVELKKVAEEYNGVRPGFDAQIQVGNLYMNHGDSKQAVEWYEKATQSAPGPYEKTLSHVAAASTLENTSQYQKALDHLKEAIGENVETLKGEVLHGIARNHVALLEVEKAKKIYDQIISELPNTAYSKKATTYRAQLPQ